MSNFNESQLAERQCCETLLTIAKYEIDSMQQEREFPSNGVYIQDVNYKLWKAEDWDGSVKPNAIAVIENDDKFLIALTQPQKMSLNDISTVDFWHDIEIENNKITNMYARYDGMGKTASILKTQPSTEYAAGYCNAFIFPDGKTRGYLPTGDQLQLAYQNKVDVTAALQKCGGAKMESEYYWSSSSGHFYEGYSRGEMFRWIGGYGNGCLINSKRCVRPFADFQ